MPAASAAALPPEIARADRFIPSLSAYSVDLVLRRKELQAERARLLAAEYLLDVSERRLFRAELYPYLPLPDTERHERAVVPPFDKA